MFLRFIFFVLTFYLHVYVYAQDKTQNPLAVLDDLLQNYDKRTRPGFGGERLVLELDMYVSSLNVDETTNPATVTLQGYVRAYWIDERLKWPETSQFFPSMAIGNSDVIWTPDLFISNAVAPPTHLSEYQLVTIENEGRVLWSRRLSIPFGCAFNLHKYPFDTQTCQMEIELYHYNMDDVEMNFERNISVSTTAATGNWQITGVGTNNMVTALSTGTYQRLSAEFTLTRQQGSYIKHVYIPCVLIVILSWLGMLINHREFLSLRIAIGVVTLLVIFYIAGGSSNGTVNYVTSIELWMGFCFLFVLASFLQLCFLVACTKCCRNQGHRYQPTTVDKQQSEFEVTGKDKANQQSRFSCHRLCDLICLVSFVVLFIIFNIGYWAA